jgi:uncharacterized membrane protein YqgA involved in biofilm formation
MADLSFLANYVDPMILGICLCLGFALKEAKFFEKFDNKYIPLTMLIIGCVIGILTNIPNINASVVLGGMISGLASTGLYEMLRNLITNKNEEEK